MNEELNIYVYLIKQIERSNISIYVFWQHLFYEKIM